MNDRALEQIGHGGQADVRMRPDIDARNRAPAQQVPVVEKNERTDIRRFADGSTRRTSNPPMSRGRGTTIVSRALHDGAIFA